MLRNFLYSTCLISLITVLPASGEIYRLDLNAALELARQANPDIVRSTFNFNSAEAEYFAEKSQLYPSLKLDLTAPNFSESLNQQYVYNPVDSSYGWKWMPTGDYRFQGALALQQKLPTGGEIDISSMMYKRDYYIGSSSDSLETEYSNVMQFSLTQPLFQPNNIKLNRLRSRLNYKNAQLNREIKRRDLDYVISIAYYNLVQAERRLGLEQEDYARWQNSVETAKAKYNAGLIPEVEVLKLQVELALRQGSIAAALNSYLDSSDDLKIALGLSLTDSIVTSAEIEKTHFITGEIETARLYRQELLKGENDITSTRLTLQQTKSSFGFDAYLQAYYLFDAKQPDYNQLRENYERDRGLSLTITLPLVDWKYARRKIESAELDLRLAEYNLQQQKKDFAAELKQAERSVQAAQSRYESSNMAEELAVRSYQITLSRFETGAVSSTDLIDAQISLNQAKHELLDAVIAYNLAAVKYKTLFFPQAYNEE